MHQELVDLATSIPKNDRERVVFDKWTPKEILAHMIFWNDLNASRAQSVKENKVPLAWIKDGDLDSANEKEVAKWEKCGWGEVYEEFVRSGFSVVETFSSLPDNLWDKPSGEGNRYSPRTYLKGVTEHYKGEHTPKVKEYLDSL